MVSPKREEATMKKFLSIMVAATVIIAPLSQASAQGWPQDNRRHDGPTRYSPPSKPQFNKKHVAPKRWDRGQRLSQAHRGKFIDRRDMRRYRLAEPRRGERWVRVNDQFLLINAVNGLIRSIANVR